MHNKQETINNLNKLKVTLSKIMFSDFPELYIYPKEYYTNVISSFFNSVKTPFSYIYGDFNKLKSINDSYGKESGDKALKNGFTIIKNCLPNNALISRIGGDEIAIIIPDSDKIQALGYKKKIEDTFKQYNKYSTGLSITLAAEDSTNNTVEQLEHLTESQVSRKKNSRNPKTFASNLPSNDSLPLQVPSNIDETEAEKWKILNSYINMSVENHLADIRPSKSFTYNIEDFKNEIFYLIDSLKDYLESNIKNGKSKQLSNSHNDNLDKNVIPADKKTITLVHSLLTSTDFSYKNISQEDLLKMQKFMEELLNTLITNKNNTLFNKGYLKNYLAEEISKSKTDFQTIFINTSGIKLSNTAFGHHFTDMRIDKTTSIIQEILSKHYHFNDKAFSFSPEDSHFIDYGGGNYLLLIPKEKFISQKDLNKILQDINTHYDSQNPESSFQVSGMMSEFTLKTDKQTLIKFLRDFKNSCDNTKDELKKDAFTSITQKKAFENSISKAIEYYLRIIPDSKDDIVKKKILISNFFTSLVNQEGSHNIQSNIYKQFNDSVSPSGFDR